VLKLSVDELKALSVDKKEFRQYIDFCVNAMKNQGYWTDSYQERYGFENDYNKLLNFANGDY